MVHLDPQSDLSIAEVAFYVPALLVGIYINIKHGFHGGAPWLYLCILCILRLIGASCWLYIGTNNDQSTSLYEAAFICSSIGIMPLFNVLLGILIRLSKSSGPQGINKGILFGLHYIAIPGIVLLIVGAVELQENNSASSFRVGKDLLEAGGVLFAAIFVAMVMVTFLTVVKRRLIPSFEKPLLIAAVAVLPFLCVRVVYTVTSTFASPGSSFYFLNVSVPLQAGMTFAMEAVCVLIYSAAAIMTPKFVAPQRDEYAMRDVEEQKFVPLAGSGAQQSYDRPQHQRQSRASNSKSWYDYLPTVMIYKAIRGGSRN